MDPIARFATRTQKSTKYEYIYIYIFFFFFFFFGGGGGVGGFTDLVTFLINRASIK